MQVANELSFVIHPYILDVEIRKFLTLHLNMPIKKCDSSGFGSEVHWNTARCHRLIRPLVSSIHAFGNAQDGTTDKNDPASCAHANATSLFQRESKRSKCSDHEDENDLEWGAPVPRKRLKRTYSDRCRSRTTHQQPAQDTTSLLSRTRPGEITIPTPFLKRTRCRAPADDTPRMPRSSSSTKDLQSSNLTGVKLQSGYQTSLDSLAMFRRVLDAFERILVATTTQNPYPVSRPQAPGPLSLFSLCLQKVPAYMVEEEQMCKEMDPDDPVDVSAEIYAELENLEHLPGRGWKHLSVVVRAHAVSLLERAISEISMSWSCIDGILNACRKHNASIEAERLFAAFSLSRTWTTSVTGSKLAMELSWRNAVLHVELSNPNIDQRKSGETIPKIAEQIAENDVTAGVISHRRRPLVGSPALLQKLFGSIDGIYGAKFRHFIELLKASRLSLATLTEPNFRPLWDHVIRSIADQNDDAIAATGFIEQVFIHSCGLTTVDEDRDTPVLHNSATEQGAEAIENTIFSLLTILSSIKIASQDVLREYQLQNSVNDELRPLHIVSHMIRRGIRSTNSTVSCASLRHTLLRMAILATEVVTLLMISDLTLEILVETIDQCLNALFILNKIHLSRSGLEQTAIASLSELVCSIARCVARACGSSTFEVLHDLVLKLLAFEHNLNTIAVSRSPTNFERSQHATLMCRQLALGTAMSFAQESPDPAHIAFAQDIEVSISRTSTVATFRTPSKTPRRTLTQKNRFRWEEGICEWVMATPASNMISGARPRSEMLCAKTPHGRLYLSPKIDTYNRVGQCGEALNNIDAANSYTNVPRLSRPQAVVAPDFNEAEDKENITQAVDLTATTKQGKPQVGQSIPIDDGLGATSHIVCASVHAEEDEDELSMHAPSSQSMALQQSTQLPFQPVVVIPVLSASVIARSSMEFCRSDDRARVTRSAVARGWVAL